MVTARDASTGIVCLPTLNPSPSGLSITHDSEAFARPDNPLIMNLWATDSPLGDGRREGERFHRRLFNCRRNRGIHHAREVKV